MSTKQSQDEDQDIFMSDNNCNHNDNAEESKTTTFNDIIDITNEKDMIDTSTSGITFTMSSAICNGNQNENNNNINQSPSMDFPPRLVSFNPQQQIPSQTLQVSNNNTSLGMIL